MPQTDDKRIVELLAVSPEMVALYHELRKSEQMMANAQRIAHFGSWEFYMSDPSQLEGNAVRWSDEVFRIYGYEPGEIVASVEVFMDRVHPEDLQMVREKSMHALQCHTKISFDHRIVRPDGSVRWVHEEASVSKDNIRKEESGPVLYVTGTVLDITDLKVAELERTAAVRMLVTRNSDLERLAFMVSHELRAPVTTILGLAALLQEEKLSEVTRDECIAGLVSSVKKIDETIADLYTIFDANRHKPEEKKFIRFTDVVRDVALVLGLDENALHLTTDFSAAEGITTLRSFMHSIFQNLIANSVKYCRDDAPAALHISTLRTKDSIIVSFNDNCMGIDLLTHAKNVFGMRQRFHAHIEGAGIGLYMVKTQMETLGGKVHVRSTVQEGSEFILEFPIESGPAN